MTGDPRVGFFIFRAVFDPAVEAVEGVNPATTGYLGGLGLPVVMSWPVGGLLAAGAAWIIGKAALGLRSDYLAIATLGIAEIIIAVLKNEDWMSRGVKNVIGLPRPVPNEVDLQNDPAFVERATWLGIDPTTASSLYVKAGYAVLFAVVLLILLWLAQKALQQPLGPDDARHPRQRDRRRGNGQGRHRAAPAGVHPRLGHLRHRRGDDDDARRTAVPTTYQPLRFTFLIWVMVIVGGSGNNLGAVLGGFLIWFLWVQVEPISALLMDTITAGMAEGNAVRAHLLESTAHMRLLTMGLILLLVLRFSPRGLIPEK